MSGTQIEPTLKKTKRPSLTMLLDSLKQEILKEINCVKVGVIQAFDYDKQEATVQIAYKQITSVAPNGTRTYSEYPLLLRVPVQYPSGGGCTLTFPISPGDECIVLFNDQQIDNWLTNGDDQPLTLDRVHDLADGIAIVGIRNNTRPLENISENTAQLRTDSGLTFVSVDPNYEKVIVHAGTVYEWDCHGYGFRYTWLGSKNYQIDFWGTDAIITTINHALSQPGPP